MKKIFSVETISRVFVEVILIGIVVFFIQGYFQSKWQPMTASETLRKENFLNAKRDVYFQAIELVNRAVGHYTLITPGKPIANRPRNRGSKFPSEFEVNNCFSKLCIYSDNKEITRLFKKIFLANDSTAVIAVMEDFINLIRQDLGYGQGIVSPRTNEYEYIEIGKQDTL